MPEFEFSYDGYGLNDATDPYRPRVLTFAKAPHLDDENRRERMARLLCAAPELLAALGACADFIENCTDDDPQRSEKFFATRALWRNAFAKAMGGA